MPAHVSFPAATSTKAGQSGGGGGGGGGGNTISGVQSASGTPVAGGTVQLIQASAVISTATPDGSGAYSFGSLADGTYQVQNQPPTNYCIADNGIFTAVVSGASTVTQNLAIQRVFAGADFSLGYSTANILAGTPWISYSSVTASMLSVSQGSANPPKTFAGAIVNDATGGPSGGASMRYDWPAQPNNWSVNPSLDDYYVDWQPRIILAGISNLTECWARIRCKEGSSFEHGASAAVQARAYKFFLINFEDSTHFNNRFGTYLRDALTDQPLGTAMIADVSSSTGGGMGASNVSTTLGVPTYGGSYHTWVIGMQNLSSTTAIFSIYKDGVLLAQFTSITFLNGVAIGGSGWAVEIEAGSNINNGPDDAQSRWFSEISVSPTRPSLI